MGAGTGTSAFGWKGGIGTASRVLPRDYGGFTVGVLVQTNSPLFQAVIEATEEAVYNSLLAATTMTGNGHTVEALPIDELRRLLRSTRR